MANRFIEPRNPVEIEHDGSRVVAERGEPIAVALVAADRLVLGRSAKLHRPRGPYCLAGVCDGCLARVDGVANVMTCLEPARGGERIETQNVLGTRKTDLLRAADFLFPNGIDHHRLLAGVPGASALMQRVARRVAGLGRLPDVATDVRPAEKRAVEVLVVGAGATGLEAAAALGSRCVVVEQAIRPGGGARLLEPERAEELLQRALDARAEVRSSTTALAMFDAQCGGAGRVLVGGPHGAELLEPGAILLAPGTRAPTAGFPGGDVPGVFSARAGLALLRSGILVDSRVAIVGADAFSRAFVKEASDEPPPSEVAADRVVRAIGRSRVSGLVVRDDEGREHDVHAGAVLVGGTGTRAHELALQAGATVRFDAARGYVPEHENGQISSRVFIAGGAADHPELAAILGALH